MLALGSQTCDSSSQSIRHVGVGVAKGRPPIVCDNEGHRNFCLCQAAQKAFLLYNRLFRKLRCREVHFTAEQEAQLAEMANKSGTNAEGFVKDAALRLLAEETGFRPAVREDIAQADQGEFIEEEEMDARFEQMLRS